LIHGDQKGNFERKSAYHHSGISVEMRQAPHTEREQKCQKRERERERERKRERKRESARRLQKEVKFWDQKRGKERMSAVTRHAPHTHTQRERERDREIYERAKERGTERERDRARRQLLRLQKELRHTWGPKKKVKKP